jgi:tRNA(fMet)-specific endonuclease VapC
VARQVILDTGILIASERCQLDLESVIGHDDPAISAVTAMELLVGAVARMHALLSIHVRKLGLPRGAHDLIIAATAAVTGRPLLTTDAAAGFDGLPGVRAEVVSVR